MFPDFTTGALFGAARETPLRVPSSQISFPFTAATLFRDLTGSLE